MRAVNRKAVILFVSIFSVLSSLKSDQYKLPEQASESRVDPLGAGTRERESERERDTERESGRERETERVLNT